MVIGDAGFGQPTGALMIQSALIMLFPAVVIHRSLRQRRAGIKIVLLSALYCLFFCFVDSDCGPDIERCDISWICQRNIGFVVRLSKSIRRVQPVARCSRDPGLSADKTDQFCYHRIHAAHNWHPVCEGPTLAGGCHLGVAGDCHCRSCGESRHQSDRPSGRKRARHRAAHDFRCGRHFGCDANRLVPATTGMAFSEIVKAVGLLHSNPMGSVRLG